MDYKKRNGGPLTGGAPQAKWAKKTNEWEDSPSQFEEELSMFNDADMDIDDMEGQAGHDVIPVGVYCTKNSCKIFIFSMYLQFIISKTTDLNLTNIMSWKRIVLLAL